MVSKLQWDLSNEQYAASNDQWLVAVTKLASSLEALISKLPNPKFDVAPSLLWEVQLDAGINVRAAPTLQSEKVGSKLEKGTTVRVTEEVSADGEWVKLDNYEGVEVAWARFRSSSKPFMVPVPDPEATEPDAELSCPWLSTSLSLLLYNVGQQTLKRHPNELLSGDDDKPDKDKDSSGVWLKSALVVGGPNVEPTEQFKSICNLMSIPDPEVRESKLLANILSFEAPERECPWWDSCAQSPGVKLPEKASELEVATTKAVFDAMLRHAGLETLPLSNNPPDEVLKCFQGSIDFFVEVRSNYSAMAPERANNNLHTIRYKAEFLNSSLEPALKPYRVQESRGLVRTRTKNEPLRRTKSQISRMKKSELASLGMLDLSQQDDLQDLALDACMEEVLGFLQDTKINLVRLATELTKRVTRAKCRALRLASALHFLHQGTHNADRRLCTELLLLQLAGDQLHFLEGLNGCGRALRTEITDVWHQCIEIIAMPLVSDPQHETRMAALTAVSTLWGDHDLSFLSECDMWNNLQLATAEEPEAASQEGLPDDFDDLKRYAIAEVGMLMADVRTYTTRMHSGRLSLNRNRKSHAPALLK
eukprot:TRINITY_DN6504_c0_g1_i3.p1 TRINITY_DN6504_c0_g1~~TRINITY_DN6504_c0_g1_i3.p1  ORF type:complete len:592 (-),score=171.11 TRINITY_DN6504_c0_g1_i3:643-2418(-)